MTRSIFVYGTLKRRSRYHHLLGGARFVAKASMRGVLYDLGAYPGLVQKRTAAHSVLGELYELPEDRAPRLLRALDRYEGREFLRRRVFVRLRNGRRRAAWTYVLKDAPARAARPIRSGHFPVRRAAS